MGFARGSVAISRPHANITFQLILSHLKSIFEFVLFRNNSRHRSEPQRDYDHEPHDRPPASLVQLPPRLMADSIKKRDPAMRITECGARKEGSDLLLDPLCVVCMDGVEAEEEIRHLPNCRYVFHVECLDCWIQNIHVTCPLRRSKLLSGNGGQETDETSCGGDPWRMERMIHLFGED